MEGLSFWAKRLIALPHLADYGSTVEQPIHSRVTLLFVASSSLLEEHMAQCCVRLLTFLAVQEAVQWDLRSLFYVHPFIASFVFLFFVVVPVVQILRRTGHNPVWCLLALIPGLNFLAFWFLAFKPWPTDKKPASA
jgi:hypothetical protein